MQKKCKECAVKNDCPLRKMKKRLENILVGWEEYQRDLSTYKVSVIDNDWYGLDEQYDLNFPYFVKDSL